MSVRGHCASQKRQTTLQAVRARVSEKRSLFRDKQPDSPRHLIVKGSTWTPLRVCGRRGMVCNLYQETRAVALVEYEASGLVVTAWAAVEAQALARFLVPADPP